MTDFPASPTKTVLVKRIKVPVRPPLQPESNGTAPAMKKVLVKRVLVKVPVRQPAPAAQAPRPVPAPESRPAPAAYGAPRPAPDEDDISLRPFPYEIPSDILDRIEAKKTIPEKFLLLYIYARTLAERNAAKKGYDFPPMLIDLPRNNRELRPLFEEAAEESFYDAMLCDFMDFSVFIPGLQHVTKTNRPVEDLLEEEIGRLEEQDELTPSQQIVLAFLVILADMKSVQTQLEINNSKNRQRELMDEASEQDEEENEIKQAFVDAINRKKFPVDAEKLMTNYMNFARKEPEKAYQTLITNPLFFSPIQLEKLPRRLFGLLSPSPADAKAVNKKLAAFLKNLQV